MAVTGDFAKFEAWKKFFKDIGASDFERDIITNAATACMKLIDEGFDKEQDPVNKSWEPKKRPNGLKVLEGPTKDLRSGFKLQFVSKDTFKISNSVKYFRPHQYGANRNGTNWKLPKRQMMPTDGKLPPAYSDAFRSSCRKHWLKRLKKV